MTNNKDFPDQLTPRKSTSLPVKKTNQDRYVEELETEKTNLLAQVTNYEKEQKASVKVFKEQANLLDQKEQQLTAQDQLISEQEVAIAKLKTRIHELAKELNFLKKFDQVSEETKPTEIATQTIGISPSELEEQLLEKRLQSLQEFSTYREKLAIKENEITQLNNQITLYQQKIRKLSFQPNRDEKKLFLLTVLLIITISLLFFK